MSGMTRAQAERKFWATVNIGSPNECWPWLAGACAMNRGAPWYRIPRCGYGHLFDETRTTSAYRIAYRISKGPIPKGMTVDHICFNPLCCNPAHLQLLTRQENSARKDPAKMATFGDRLRERLSDRPRNTHCRKGHQLTPENTWVYVYGRQTQRKCKKCYAEWWVAKGKAAHDARRKAQRLAA